MAQSRIQVLIESQLAAVPFGRLLNSSAATPWAGFLMEERELTAGRASHIGFVEPQLVITLSGNTYHRSRSQTHEAVFITQPGTVCLWPGDYEISQSEWSGHSRLLVVQLELRKLSNAPRENALNLKALSPQPSTRDARLVELVHAMQAELTAGCPAGALYGQWLSCAVAAYIAGRYAHDPASHENTAKLSKRQLGRVLDYLNENFKRDLAPCELADLVGLGTHRFAQLFRNSVGFSPYQFILKLRIDAAKRCLEERALSITEVALSLGFASQSHFTEVFRKRTGVTPGRYRQEH